MTSVLVVTATVGRPELRRCASSVQQQSYPNIRHLVVIDGPAGGGSAAEALDGVAHDKDVNVVVLPRPTGHSGHFGYRIYGTMPLIADEDVVLFLDEDNWFDSDHVESCLDTFEITGAAWVYALRTVRSTVDSSSCDDDCDSLGYWPKFAAMPSFRGLRPAELERHRTFPNLVDTSCYALPRTLACSVAPLWQAVHADSVVASHLVQHHHGSCTGRPTVNYALGGGSGTQLEWFTDGNSRIRDVYGPAPLPWRAPPTLLGPGRILHPAGGDES